MLNWKNRIIKARSKTRLIYPDSDYFESQDGDQYFKKTKINSRSLELVKEMEKRRNRVCKHQQEKEEKIKEII